MWAGGSGVWRAAAGCVHGSCVFWVRLMFRDVRSPVSTPAFTGLLVSSHTSSLPPVCRKRQAVFWSWSFVPVVFSCTCIFHVITSFCGTKCKHTCSEKNPHRSPSHRWTHQSSEFNVMKILPWLKKYKKSKTIWSEGADGIVSTCTFSIALHSSFSTWKYPPPATNEGNDWSTLHSSQ